MLGAILLLVVSITGIFILSLSRNGQLEKFFHKSEKEALAKKANFSAKISELKKIKENNLNKLAKTSIVLNNQIKVNKPPEQEIKAEKKVETEPIINKFSFIAIGDAEDYKTPTGHDPALADVLFEAKAHQADFFVFTGDLITTSGKTGLDNQRRIQDLKNLIESYQGKYYITFGKHDLECGIQCADYWSKIFFGKIFLPKETRKMYHSFNYGNTHFVLLSTDFPQKHSLDIEQFQWLENDLKNVDHQKTPNIIISQHVPPITFFKKSAKKCHDMSCQSGVKEQLMELYKKYKVDLVISGHEHAFDHKIEQGIDFVLVGSVGQKPRYKGIIKGDIYSLFNIDKKTIELISFNKEGKVIREIKIK